HTRCYRDWSSDVCSSDLCTTGCACTIVQGQTIHSFFKLNDKLETQLHTGTVDAELVSAVETVVIDEVSMLDADLFTKIDELLRRSEERRVGKECRYDSCN